MRLDDLYEDTLAMFEPEGEPSRCDLPSSEARDGNETVGQKGRFRGAFDTEGMEEAMKGPHGEGLGAGGGRLRDAHLRSESSSAPSPHTDTSISQVQCADSPVLV